MTDISLHDVHNNVQDYYAAKARNVDSCDDKCACGAGLYGEVNLADLPADVTNLSLGCGDPISIAQLNPGETVLDLGSGGGIDCFLAAQRVGDTGYVIGIDMTPDMLQRANQAKSRMGLHNVEFRRGQIEDLPVADDSIDVILSNCVINLAPDKRPVFAEAFRVLKPGGRFAVSDVVSVGEISEEQRADALTWSACVSGAIPVEDYMGMMREAGFDDIQVVDKSKAKETIATDANDMPHVFSARITAVKPH